MNTFCSKDRLLAATFVAGVSAEKGVGALVAADLDWQAAGVRKMDGSNLPTRNLSATLVEPDGPTGPAYLVYRNYHSILRYNCAHLYGITIGTLADRLANP